MYDGLQIRNFHFSLKMNHISSNNIFLAFVVKETKHILRDKRTMLILFGMPVVLMLMFGFAISTDVRNVRTVVVTSQMDAKTSSLVTALDASEYFIITHHVSTPSEAERLIRNQKADMAIVFGKDFASKHTGLQIITDAVNPNLAQQYFTYASQIIASHMGATSPIVHRTSPIITYLYNPQMKSAYNFVPGIMGMLLMLICAMMTSISIAKEKERGTMEVLLVSPVRPLMIIITKAVPYMLLAFCILVTILLMSKFILGVPLEGNLLLIFGVSLVYILLALSLGLLISIIAKSQLVALLLSAMVLIIPTIMLSGMIFPVESMPRILQWISAIMPPRYYISAMRKLMIMGTGLSSITTELTVLSTMALLLLTISLKKFNNRLE